MTSSCHGQAVNPCPQAPLEGPDPSTAAGGMTSMPEPLGDVTMSALHQALSGLALRQRTIADNIANIETPGFLAGEQTNLSYSLAIEAMTAKFSQLRMAIGSN